MSNVHRIAGCAVVLTLIGWAITVEAAPVTKQQAGAAAQNFVIIRYPAAAGAQARVATDVGRSSLALKAVEPLLSSGKKVGFVVRLTPAGYVLMRSDDRMPPIKLYSDSGDFTNLPPAFVKAISLELAEESEKLSLLRFSESQVKDRYTKQWAVLLNPIQDGDNLAISQIASPGVGSVYFTQVLLF